MQISRIYIKTTHLYDCPREVAVGNPPASGKSYELDDTRTVSTGTERRGREYTGAERVDIAAPPPRYSPKSE